MSSGECKDAPIREGDQQCPQFAPHLAHPWGEWYCPGVTARNSEDAFGRDTELIREALARLVAQDSWEKPYADAALAALARLAADNERLQTETAKWEAAVQSWRENYQANDDAKGDALDRAFRAEAATERMRQALEEIEKFGGYRAAIARAVGPSSRGSHTSRRKGLRGEHEVAAIFRAHSFEVRGLEGSGDHLAIRRPIEDDCDGLTIHSEVKRAETVKIWQWLAQLEAEAPPGTLPLLSFRRNRSPWYGVAPLEQLVKVLA